MQAANNKPTPRARRRQRIAFSPKTDMVREALRGVIESGKAVQRSEWAIRLGVSEGTIQRAEMQERARLEGMQENENKVSISVLIDQFVPLFQRVKEQSKRHIGLISTGELLLIASEGQRLLDRWADGDKTVRRVRGHVVPKTSPEEEPPNGSSL